MKKVFILTILFLLIFSDTSFADWKYENNTWYYPEKVGWIHEYGYDYYIYPDHSLNISPVIEDGQIYYFNTNDQNIPYGALIEKYQVQKTEKQFNNISYLEIKKAYTNPTKVCILLHALGCDKEDLAGYGCELAYKGYLVLIPDLYAHGNDLNSGSFPEIIVNSSSYIDSLLSLYSFDEVNIIGCSMGGMIGSYYTCNGLYRIKNLCMLISTPVFSSLQYDIFFYSYQNGNVCSVNDRNLISEQLDEISPEHNLERLSQTNILLLNTTSDEYIPYKAIEELEKISDETFIKLNQTGHVVYPEDFLTAISFIENKNNTY